ncbi:MAG: hypothetical protein HY298_27765 [Verrucomicrobia bacterium]|nr:hypothetical protein [Verrucomicrobiota bacterium]
MILHDADGGRPGEGMRFVTQGKHTLQVECKGNVRVEKLVVKAIPELIHCGLGFNPAIKSYGLYDMKFLKRDVLPNVTTLIIPSGLKLAPSEVDDWHRQGKRFVAQTGIHSQATNIEGHFKYWASFYDNAPFLDGIIIDEFIVNRPVVEWAKLTPERLARMERERQQYEVYGAAIKRMRADDRLKNKMLYAYVGGSGRKLNQEIIGTNFIRSIVDCGYRVALERYLFERSSEKASFDALEEFVNGLADWEAKEPGVKNHMVIAFGSFNMPPGWLNKLPNVDYLVWMDMQVQTVANNPALSGIDGLEWWTSSQSDEETVRWVGKLYRHYAIEGKTNLLTRPDPLFLTHIQNADFQKGTEGWTLKAAETGSIDVKSFPRYGRIEGRYMGLGGPADPEHIGDTFLWMKRSDKGPNTFSQTIKNLEPGRLYSMKMFSCDYNDLINPKAKKLEEASKFTGTVDIEGVDVDRKRSFTEMYASNPEPKIPVRIMYHWKVFKARGATARLTVSDWPKENPPVGPVGLEQTFNFLEIQPYRE